MLTTEFNGIQYVFEEDRLYLNGTPLLYSDMSNIAHRGGDQPAFIFDYKGRRFALPYNPAELQAILPYFKYAQNYTASPAPEVYEPVVEPAYDPAPAEPVYDPAPEVYEPVAEPYYQEDAPVQEVYAQEVYDQEVYEPVTEPAPEAYTQEVYAEEVYEPEFVSVPEPEIYEPVVEPAPVSYEQEAVPVTEPYYQEEVPAPEAYPQEVYEQDIYEQEINRAPETYEEVPITAPEIPEDAPVADDLNTEFVPTQDDLEQEFIPTPEDLEAELAPSPEDLEADLASVQEELEPAPALTPDLEPEQPPKKGLSKKIIIIGAVILAALIGAAIFFFAGGSDEAAPEDISEGDFAAEEGVDEYYEEEEEDAAPTGGDFEATDGFTVTDSDGSMDIKLSKVYLGDDALQKLTDMGEDQKEFTESAESGYKLVLYEYEVKVKDGAMIGDTVTGEFYLSDKKTEFDDWWPVDLLKNTDKDLSSGEIEIPAGETANVYIAYYMPEDLKDYNEIVLTNEDGTEIWVHYVIDK